MHPIREEDLGAILFGATAPDARLAAPRGVTAPVIPRSVAPRDDLELRRIKRKLRRFFAALWP